VSTLHIDIETRSSYDLKTCGVYKYAESPDFDVLLFAYSLDGGPVEVIDFGADTTLDEAAPIYGRLLSWLRDENVTKVAYNAQFERVCLSKWIGAKMPLPPEQWRCTMVHAAYAGVSGGLGHVADYLRVAHQKDAAGTRLINKFSKPPFQVRGADPGEWERFMDYCKQDVRTEMAIAAALERVPVPRKVWEQYWMDQHISDRGACIDTQLAARAVEISSTEAEGCTERFTALTGVNPRSLQQVHGWLEREGYPMGDLRAATVAAAIADPLAPPVVRQALAMRQIMSGAAVKKYAAMLEAVCSDGRIRGSLQFYGASRTGRWAGRLLQPQNMPRMYDATVGAARALAKDGDAEGLRLIWGSPSAILKQLVRTAILPREGHIFYTTDFSAIEARVIAWLAGEEWALEVFRGDGKIYEATAARMLRKPIDEITKEDRQRGKVATLALGYQGWVGALVQMGALDMGIPERDLADIAGAWRAANNKIVRLWGKIEHAARQTLELGCKQRVSGCTFAMRGRALEIALPSGRCLYYQRAHIASDGQIRYMGQASSVAMTTLETYGGKLTENIVQAVSRDLLAEALMRFCDHPELRDCIVFHVHDEVVFELPQDTDYKDIIDGLMIALPAWAKGLPLAAEGQYMEYYHK
jgi:DNA polymerase